MGSIGQIGAASISATSDLINNGLNMWNTWRSNEQAYDQSRKLWDLNNEYNKPINQMKRLEEAGLNPFLVYGNGATGNTSSQPSSPSVQGNRFNIKGLENLVLAKQLEAMDENLDSMRKRNDLLDYQLGNMEFYKHTGLPLNSPWYAAWLLDVISNPKKVNRLKEIGYNIGEILGTFLTAEQSATIDNKPIAVKPVKDINYGYIPESHLTVDDNGNFIFE